MPLAVVRDQKLKGLGSALSMLTWKCLTLDMSGSWRRAKPAGAVRSMEGLGTKATSKVDSQRQLIVPSDQLCPE
jgi:hypothetical protein